MKWIAFLCCLSVSVFAETEIGSVVVVQGVVEAKLNDALRVLERGDPVYVNDLIYTRERSKAQIKFEDGTIISLVPESQYQIDNYRFSQTKEKNGFLSQLIEGGLRGISGSIGKSNPEGVTIKTPTATMGIRGTIFEIKIVGGETFFGCESGVIYVSNLGGSILLGPKETHQFSKIGGGNVTPQGLSTRPAELKLSQFSMPTGCK